MYLLRHFALGKRQYVLFPPPLRPSPFPFLLPPDCTAIRHRLGLYRRLATRRDFDAASYVA